MRSSNGHHVGVLYAPPFRPFMFGRVEDKSVLHNSYASDTPSGRYRGYSNPVSLTSLHSSEGIFSESKEDHLEYELEEERQSVRSSISRDNDSFYTAKGSDDEDRNFIPDDYSIESRSNSCSGYTSDASSSNEQRLEDQRELHERREAEENNLTSAIPPSIPYSDYLRRYKVSRANSEFSHHGSFFHSYIPPSGPNFIPEKVRHNVCAQVSFVLTSYNRIMKRNVDPCMHQIKNHLQITFQKIVKIMKKMKKM